MKHITGTKNKIKEMNKKIEVLEGDVNKVVPQLTEKFDRIIMILPTHAYEYLDLALSVSKPGTIIHLYKFSDEDKIPSEVEEIVKKASPKSKIVDIIYCGDFAPGVYRICADIKVS